MYEQRPVSLKYYFINIILLCVCLTVSMDYIFYSIVTTDHILKITIIIILPLSMYHSVFEIRVY